MGNAWCSGNIVILNKNTVILNAMKDLGAGLVQ